jgi:hypothetical protein
MNKTTSNYLQLALFIILLMIFCTLFIQINKKPITSYNKINTREQFKNNNNNNKNNKNTDFSIIYHSRPEDIIWEIENIKISEKYLNVFTIKPLNINNNNNSNKFIYKPLGQCVLISDKPLTEDYKVNIKDNIELNLCGNKSFTSYNKIWDTTKLSKYADRPFSIYLGVNTDELQPVSYILKNGLDNPPSVNDFSPVPLMYVDFINDSNDHTIILNNKNKENSMNLFLKQIDNKYIHYRELPYENIQIPILKKDFIQTNFNPSENVVKLTLESNKYHDI